MLDYTKTATPCQLIAALIPALQGRIWRHANRWHTRKADGSWEAGNQRARHHYLVRNAARQLPDIPAWDRFKEKLLWDAGRNEALRWLYKAREAGILVRPDDYPFEDRVTPWRDLRCLCGKGCWTSSVPERSEPVV